jgi:hypothetical protein
MKLPKKKWTKLLCQHQAIIKNIYIGKCVGGENVRGTVAHAHNYTYDPYYGCLCFPDIKSITTTHRVLHEVAHLMVPIKSSGLKDAQRAHGEEWATALKKIGGDAIMLQEMFRVILSYDTTQYYDQNQSVKRSKQKI